MVITPTNLEGGMSLASRPPDLAIARLPESGKETSDAGLYHISVMNCTWSGHPTRPSSYFWGAPPCRVPALTHRMLPLFTALREWIQIPSGDIPKCSPHCDQEPPSTGSVTR
jgi:hypothetical protein